MSRGIEALVVVLLLAAPAAAHETAQSSFEARPAISAAGPGLQIVFRLDATSVFDLTGATGGDAVLAYLDARFAVRRADGPCPREAPRGIVHDPAAKSIVIDVIYRCGGAVTLESTLFHDELIPHTVIGTVHRAGRADRHFFTRGERTVGIDVQAPQRGGFRTATPPPGAFRTSPEEDEKPYVTVLLSVVAVLVAAFCFRRLTTS